MTMNEQHDDGINAEQHATLLPGCRAVLPAKAGVRLLVDVRGGLSSGNVVDVECRGRKGATRFTLSPGRHVAAIPAETSSVVLTSRARVSLVVNIRPPSADDARLLFPS